MGEVQATGLRKTILANLIPNPLQPRRHFDDTALAELTASIREKGILQPLIVRPSRKDVGMFEIIAGERRWRAAQRAQVHEVPVIVRDLSDGDAFTVALIENIQRDQLSPLEEASAYARLAADFTKTQAQISQLVGKSRSHIANTLRLLDLPENLQALLAEGKLTAGHGRAILSADNPSGLAKLIIEKGLSVREAERLAIKTTHAQKRKRVQPAKNADTLALETQLTRSLGAKVEIAFDGRGGSIRVKYSSLEQLDELIERLSSRNVNSSAME